MSPEPENKSPINKPKKLRNRQKIFIDEYLRSWNATQAAIKAGYSKKTARFIGSENLTKPNIKAEIQRHLAERVMSAEEVLNRLSNMARANLFPFMRITDDGFVYFNFSDPEAQQFFYLIKKIKTKRTRRLEGRGKDAEQWEDEWVEVELHDAQSALEKIGKHYRLFSERVETIDLTKLTIEQLERLARGEDILNVLTANTGASGA